MLRKLAIIAYYVRCLVLPLRTPAVVPMLAVLGCVSLKSGLPNAAGSIPDTTGISAIARQWREDSLGCSRIRDRKKAKLLSEYILSKSMNRADVVLLLGAPDKLGGGGGKLNMEYYFDAFCQNDVVVDTLDYCWMNIVVSLKSDSVMSINMPCS